MADYQSIFGKAGVETVVGGTNVTIDNTDPANPIINVSGVGSIAGWTPSANTASPNNTVNASRLLVNSASANGDAVIQPKGTGALLASLPDGLISGGNKRGEYAVDLQLRRVNNNEVASGNYSVILGGFTNRATASFSVVVGGESNYASANYSAVVGGKWNEVELSANYGFIGGGENNTIDSVAEYGTISGGSLNSVNKIYGTIGGGSTNIVDGDWGTVAGGMSNDAIGGGSSIGGGNQNKANGLYSVIVGGNGNIVDGNYSVAAGSLSNANRSGMIAYACAALPGGGESGVIQREQQILLYQTTDAVPEILTTNGLYVSATNKLFFNTYDISRQGNSAYAFHGLVTARRKNVGFEQTAMWEIKGGVKYINGTTQLVGSPIISTLGDESSGVWSVEVAANNTTDSLDVIVTGADSQTINWACTITLMKV